MTTDCNLHLHGEVESYLLACYRTEAPDSQGTRELMLSSKPVVSEIDFSGR